MHHTDGTIVSAYFDFGIVQLDAVSHGEFDVTLRDGSVARISRTYRALLERRLRQPL